jgi:hypothetical protein
VASAILDTLEAEIKRIEVHSHLEQIVCENLSQKYSTQKTVAQVVGCLPSKYERGPEFKVLPVLPLPSPQKKPRLRKTRIYVH